MAFVLFITGASGSGKTTLYEYLRHDTQFRSLEFHDVDEHGVPPVGRSLWRSFRAQELLYEADRALEAGKSSVICGIIKPHEIVESRYFRPEMNVHFVTLDVDYETVEARLRQRLADQPTPAALDPEFDPDAVTKLFLSTRELLRELRVTTAQQKNGRVLDAGRLSKEELCEAAVKLVRALGGKG